MRAADRLRVTGAILVSGFLALVSGCGSATNTASYVPSEQSGRDALTAALNAWKAGQKPERIEGATPAIQPMDFQWTEGKKLRDFEVLEELAGEGPRQFRVKLTLEGAAAQEVR